MKTPFIYIALLILGLTVGTRSVHAADGAPAATPATAEGAPPPSHKILQVLLQMDKEELERLRATIERIEMMPEAEKKLLQQKIYKIREMGEGEQREMRKRFEGLSKETREAMHQRWLSMDTEERNQWREKLRNMPPEERAKVFEAEGFFPHSPGGMRERPGQPAQQQGERD